MNPLTGHQPERKGKGSVALEPFNLNQTFAGGSTFVDLLNI